MATLTIALFITTAQIITAKSLGARLECPPLPTTCSCSFVFGDLEIQCPIDDPNIIVRIQPSEYVQIECAKMSEKDYAFLPQMEIGDSTRVQIRRCPLPRGQSLKSIINRLGIGRVRFLLFQSYGTDLGNTLVREHLRGFNDLERLALRGNGLSDLPADLFSDLGNLTWLDLSSNRVHLPKDIFVNLDKLNYLELGFNKLERLEPGIFRNQKHLKHLNMWSNRLQNLSMESFEGISSITALDLSANELTSLEPDVFKLLTNLEVINLSKNNFTELPEGLFSSNWKLREIRLLENLKVMETLPSGFLADLPELAEVRIKASLRNLPGNMFAGSESIQNVSLAGNLLEALPAELFSNQSNLIKLDLHQNKLTGLPDDIFAYTRSLVILDLSYNKLENISSDLLRNLPKLIELNLQNNNLHHIDLQAFVGVKQLQKFNAQNNYLSFKDVAIGFTEAEAFEIGSPFQSLSELKVLNLRNNSISYIFRDWTFSFPRLERLDLSHNDINMLDIRDLQFVAQFLTVDLTSNNIEEVNFRAVEEILLPEKKISVQMGKNPLICNCIILHFVQYLHGVVGKELKNNLSIVPGELKCAAPENLKGKDVTSLKYQDLLCQLDSPQSQQKKCPSMCRCWVRSFDLSLIVNCTSAGLTKVPPLPIIHEFGMRSIELHIESNKISSLPGNDHPGYAQVRELYAKNNNISHITAKNIPSSLLVLDLSNNSLAWINTTVFEAANRTSQLTRLSLGNNPWRCDCDARHLLSFVRTNFKRIQDLSLMKCTTGARFSSLSPGDLCTEDQVFVIVACVVAVFGLLFGILASLYYRFQSEIKVWLFAHNMCLWFVTEDELDKDKKYDAFISYSHKDEDFVTEKLLPSLENGPIPYKLCLHERDWVPGEFIPTQIIQSVNDS